MGLLLLLASLVVFAAVVAIGGFAMVRLEPRFGRRGDDSALTEWAAQRAARARAPRHL